MTHLRALIKRNVKLFFRDKGMFFTSLITPLILLVLYATFLANVYESTFLSVIPAGFPIDEKLMNGLVASQPFSSLLSVSCVTVAFCSNMLMVQDKANGSRKDLTITPVKGPILALSYFIATFISTLIICTVAMGACLVYIATVGWYLSLTDILFVFLDVLLLVMFGTALSSIVNFFLTTQGQISAVGTIVSTGYGFISGSYMPISQFGEGLRNTVMLLPGTYGTGLLRNAAMRGVLEEFEAVGIPKEVIEGIKDGVDCNLYFFGEQVSIPLMYLILSVSVAVLMGIYIILNIPKSAKR